MQIGIGERIKKRREQLKLQQSELAIKMGWEATKQSNISHYERGKRTVNTKLLNDFAHALDVTPEWLLTGRSNKETLAVIRDTSLKVKLPIISWDFVSQWVEPNFGLKKYLSSLKFLENHMEEYAGPRDLFAMVVENDVMVGKNMQFIPDSILIVKRVSDEFPPKSGDFIIYCAPNSQNAIFRQYTIDGEKAFLKPLNENYQTIEIDSSGGGILGVVVEQRLLILKRDR